MSQRCLKRSDNDLKNGNQRYRVQQKCVKQGVFIVRKSTASTSSPEKRICLVRATLSPHVIAGRDRVKIQILNEAQGTISDGERFESAKPD